MSEIEQALRTANVNGTDRDLILEVVQKMQKAAYDRGLDEGIHQVDPEAIYGRMLAEQELSKTPAPIWG
jgi:hypothetical protein